MQISGKRQITGLTFANWDSKIANFMEVISEIQIRNLISQNKMFHDLRPNA